MSIKFGVTENYCEIQQENILETFDIHFFKKIDVSRNVEVVSGKFWHFHEQIVFVYGEYLKEYRSLGFQKLW